MITAEEIPKGQFHYKLRLVDGSSYKIELACNIEGILKELFNKSPAFRMRPGGVSMVQEMAVPSEMLKLVKSVIYAKVNEIGQRARRDKIKLLNFAVESAKFKKTSETEDKWIFMVDIKGDCIDDR